MNGFFAYTSARLSLGYHQNSDSFSKLLEFSWIMCILFLLFGA